MSSLSSPSPSSQSPLLAKTPEQLKVTELREELRRRGITPKGLKKELVEKLEEALRIEEAQRKAAEAIGTVAPVVAQEQTVTETMVLQSNVTMVPSEATIVQSEATIVQSDATIVQETLVGQPIEEVKGTQGVQVLEAEKGGEAEKVGTFPEQELKFEPFGEKERTVEAETRPAEAVIEEHRRLAETTSVNKPAETVIEDGPAETTTSVDKPTEDATEEQRGGNSASVDMSMEVNAKPESALTTATEAVVKESIETTVEEKMVVETVTTEVRTSDGELTRTEETTVVESLEVVQDIKMEVPKEEIHSAVQDKKTVAEVKHEELPAALQKQESQESLAIDAGDKKEEQEVVKEEVPKDEAKRQEGASMDIDSEAQAGMKRKEHEVPALDQAKRLRKWNSGKDMGGESKSGDNMSPGVNVGLAGSNSVGSRSVVDRISKPVVSTPKSEASNNGRIVPESTKIPTDSLRIDRFVRPFTLKALKDLLAETGSFSDFWIDHIKTHCYVTYSSVAEAIATRNALYNLRWPAIGGKELIADFVDPEEVKQKCESGNSKPAGGAANPTVSVPRAASERSSLASPNTPVSPFPRPVKEKPQKKEPEPIVTLDDLFKKTVAKPNIYYLPLTDAQVAAKRAAKT